MEIGEKYIDYINLGIASKTKEGIVQSLHFIIGKKKADIKSLNIGKKYKITIEEIE